MGNGGEKKNDSHSNVASWNCMCVVISSPIRNPAIHFAFVFIRPTPARSHDYNITTCSARDRCRRRGKTLHIKLFVNFALCCESFYCHCFEASALVTRFFRRARVSDGIELRFACHTCHRVRSILHRVPAVCPTCCPFQ